MHMAGSRVTQKQLQIKAGGLTDAQAAKLSGADMQQLALATAASTSVGPGKDGARLAQMEAGF